MISWVSTSQASTQQNNPKTVIKNKESKQKTTNEKTTTSYNFSLSKTSPFYEEKKLQIWFLYYFLLFAGFIVLPFAFFLPKGVKYALLSLPIFAVIFAVIFWCNWEGLANQRKNIKKMSFLEFLLQLCVGIVPLLSIILMKKNLRLMLFCYFVWIFISIAAFCKFSFDLGNKFWVILLVIILFAHLAIPLHLSLGKVAKIIYLVASYIIIVPLLWYFYYSTDGMNEDRKKTQRIYGTAIFCLLITFLIIPGVIRTNYREILSNIGLILLFNLVLLFHFNIQGPAKEK